MDAITYKYIRKQGMGMTRARRSATAAVTWMGWAVLAFEVTPFGPHLDSLSRLALAVAACGTLRMMLWNHQRPISRAYELGYEMGRRDQMKDINARKTKASVTAIRAIFDDAVND